MRDDDSNDKDTHARGSHDVDHSGSDPANPDCDEKNSCISSLGESPEASLPDLPPNGGWIAWSQVIASHLVTMNSFGYINSYGVFQQYYATHLNQAPSNISWIGSIAGFLVYGLGMFSGRLKDAGYHRETLAVGLFLQVLGVFMSSISTQYWQLFLSQGLCQGIGNGLVFCPTIASISQYFTTKRAIAISLVASGGATGGLIFPAIAQSLLHHIGFPWTLRVMGFVILFNAIVIMALTRPRSVPPPVGSHPPLVDWAAFRDLPFTLYCIGVFFMLWGVFPAYYFARPFAKDILHTSENTTFDILLVLNGMGAPGRIIPALIADRWTGAVNFLVPTAFMASICLYCWTAVDSLSSMYAFVAMFGLPGGGTQSLFPAGLATISSDMSKIGIRMGMCLTAGGFGAFTGPPIMGALIQSHMGQYLNAQIFTATVMLVGGLFILAARFARTGFHLKVRM